jgi:2-isopropylmalate synthase
MYAELAVKTLCPPHPFSCSTAVGYNSHNHAFCSHVDGTQGESISASVDDKIKIARRLMAFGVDFVEAGWPGSNPKDVAFFERAKAELTEGERSKLVAFGSTRRKHVRAEDDGQVRALLDSLAPTVCLVAKAHSLQVQQVLQASLEENLNMIRDTVSFLTRQHNRTVLVDLEHFFDGYAHDPGYALQCCQAAADAGAACLVLCDTNGGTMPWQLSQVCRDVVRQDFAQRDVTVGIHTHNDCGMAVANSLLACEAGIRLVQGTINGIGERTGNADLTSIVPSLALHCDAQLGCGPALSELTELSRFVDEILNRTPNQAAPYVGSSAFAHKVRG